MIEQADILKWIRDNAWMVDTEWMPRFHAVLCDPPYFLASISKRFGAKNAAPARPNKNGEFHYGRLSRGFMGQTWDGFDDVYHFQSWVTEWGRGLLDFVYPNSFGLFFGGTRTAHRLAAGLEDAGWTIYDVMMYLYGCLDEETEILTDVGWVRYHMDIENRRILCYNVENDSFEWNTPSHVYRYQYADTAYRIQSDFTDQIVSRNHRCLIEREGKMVFEFAEDASQQSEIRVPILENMQALSTALSNAQSNSGTTKRTLFGLWEQRGETKEATFRAKVNSVGLSRVWEGILQTNLLSREKSDSLLLSTMQRQSKGARLGEAWIQGIIISNARNSQGDSPQGCEQPSLEGWRDLPQAQGKLRQSIYQICSMPAGIYHNGAVRWLCDGTSSESGTGNWKTAESEGSCSPRRSRCDQQFSHESDVICQQSRSQIVRTSRYTRTDLARIEPIYYKGVMWCPTVSTGAFVARRNGKIFVTGNSGFPKAHSVDGYKNSLKPAYEPLIVARAPRDDTYEAHFRQHGVGMLDVDAGRIATKDKLVAGGSLVTSPADMRDGAALGMFQSGTPNTYSQNEAGRYPANVILDDEAGVLLDTQSGERKAGGDLSGDEPGRRNYVYGSDARRHEWESYDDSGGASRFFYTAKASRWEREVGLEAFVPQIVNDGRDTPIDNPYQRGDTERRNVHPTVKPIQLIEYLAKLILPPIQYAPRRLLVPFAGVGSEVIGAKLAGWDQVVGIEREAQYAEIAEARLRWWSQFSSYAEAKAFEDVRREKENAEAKLRKKGIDPSALPEQMPMFAEGE